MTSSNSVVVATRDFPREERTQAWMQEIHRHVIGVDCPESDPERGIDALLEQRESSLITVNRITADAHSVQRSFSNIQTDRRQSVFLCAMQEGNGYSWQGTACANHSAGDLVLYDTALPYGHGFPENMSMFVVDIPKSILANAGYQWQQSNLIKLQKELSLGKLSCSDLHKLLNRFLEGNANQHVLAEQLLEQLCNLLQARDIRSTQKPQHLMLQRSLAFIDSQLHNEELDDEMVSRAMGISSRQMARIFALRGDSVSRYIWNRRLERCREDILANASETVSQIAFRWGFNHSAHFSRRYKSRFGETPSQTRRNKFPPTVS